MKNNFRFELGTTLVDAITGFKGVVTGRGDYLTGCNTYNLQPKMKDGSHVDSRWFDENRLSIDTKAKKIVIPTETVSGGPQDYPASK